MSKLLYTRFTKIIINHFLSNNKSIPYRSSSKLPSSQDDQPITKLSKTIKGDYKFRIEIPDTMISDAIKKLAGYKFYMAKKVESKKAKIVDEPEEQHVSPVKSKRGKEFICYGDQVANVSNKLKKDVVPRKTRTLTILEEIVVGSKASRLESLKQKKQVVAGEGSSVAHNKYYDSFDNDSDATLHSSRSDKTEESENESNDVDESNMDLSDDNPHGDDDTLLDETPANELMNFMSHPVYTDAQTTSVVHNSEGNPKLTSNISCASEVPHAFEKAIQARVLTEIKKLLPTHISKAVANYFRPRLNTSVLDLKLLNRIYSNKSNKTRTNHQQLYDTLYESITLDQQALDAQDEEPSFHKRPHDNQDPPNNREGENKKKGYLEDEYIWTRRNPKWYTKSGSTGVTKRKTTRFDLLLKANINQNENHILGPSTAVIAKKLKAIIQKDELTIADLEDDSTIDFFKAEMSTRIQGSVYSDLRIKLVVRVVIKKKWGYGFLTSIVVWIFDDKEYKFSYADLPRLSLNDIEDMYFFSKSKRNFTISH
ncbi:hypothetical protein Tco_1215951 [Tanacetum coccineum]